MYHGQVEKMISLNKLQCVVLLLAIVNTLILGQVAQVTVDANCSNFVGGSRCLELDEALGSFESGMTLLLRPGVHTVYNSTIVQGLTNISIVGTTELSRNQVTITCSKRQGLSFSNINGLSLSNIIISNCGLSGKPLAETVATLRAQMDVFIVIPTSIQVAVFMGLCKDLSMVNVTVTNTTGIGLIGVNILGISAMYGLEFIYNCRTSCTLSASKFSENFGGGAYFFYGDFYLNNTADSLLDMPHTLMLAKSRFEFNSDCSLQAKVSANYQYFSSGGNEVFYTVGGGGGLTVILAQKTFPVDISVTSSSFYRNRARYGGGSHIGLFSGIEISRVYFIDCIFDSNQGETESTYSGGAGLAVFTGMFNPLYDNMSIISEDVRVTVAGSSFVGNSAVKGGGLFTFSLFNGQTSPVNTDIIESFSVLFFIYNCTFIRNSAVYGAGLSFQQRVDYGYNGKVGIVLRNVTVAENMHTNSNTFTTNADASALHLESVAAIIFDDLEIRDNAVTGLHIYSSVMSVSSDANITFSRNYGLYGGGVHLAGITPVIVAAPNTTILFKENSATLQGGAVYVTPRSMSADDVLRPINDECFFLPLPSEGCRSVDCFDLRSLNIRVIYQDNVAPLGGTVYGSTLDSCRWSGILRPLRDRWAPDLHILEFLAVFFPEVVSIDRALNDSSIVSTPGAAVIVNASKAELMPGQISYLSIAVLDEYNNVISSIVSSLVTSYSDNSSKAISILGEGGFWFTLNNTYPDAMFEITGQENTYVNVTFYTTDTIATQEVTFKLSPCPLGILFEPTYSSCACDSRIYDKGILCDSHTFNITVPDNIWMGTDGGSNPNDDDLIISKCPLGCKIGPKTFNMYNINSQCLEELGRAGVLCGGCAQNLSAMFSSGSCQRCSNYSLLLIPVFALAGVALFVAVALLGFTIDKPWINIALFYCNIISLYGNILSIRYNINWLFVPPSLLSLQIGTGLCFYNGMTALARTGIQLIFPLYLYFMIIVFALLCRRYYWLSERFSPASTFVTLTIMSYISTLGTGTEIMGGLTLVTLDRRESVRWQIDPNHRYFQGLHAPLVVFGAVLFALYIIPIPFILLFPTLLYKYGKKYKPFYDVLWAPFRLEFRFWLGVRLIVLLVLFALPRIFDTSYTLISIIILVILQYIQLVIKPFTRPIDNYIDSFLTLTVTILLLGAEYKEFYGGQSISESVVEYIFLIFIVGAGYVTVVVLFYLQLSHKFPIMKSPFHSCCNRSPKQVPNVVTHTEVSLDEIAPSSQTHLNFELNHSVPQLRESLLEN